MAGRIQGITVEIDGDTTKLQTEAVAEYSEPLARRLIEKSMSATFSPSEIPFVYENVLRSYQVDRRKMSLLTARKF